MEDLIYEASGGNVGVWGCEHPPYCPKIAIVFNHEPQELPETMNFSYLYEFDREQAIKLRDTLSEALGDACYKACHYCGKDYLKTTMSFVEVSNSHKSQWICDRDDCL